jgi:hypothetical protein
MLRLALLLMLCLSSLMDLTITHMVFVHKRTTLCLDALDTAHILIVVIISHVGLVFLLVGHVAHEFQLFMTYDWKQEMVLQPHSPVTQGVCDFWG